MSINTGKRKRDHIRITERQLNVLNHIHMGVEEYGICPRHCDIAEDTGLHYQCVFDILCALENNGYIQWPMAPRNNRNANIIILPKGMDALSTLECEAG